MRKPRPHPKPQLRRLLAQRLKELGVDLGDYGGNVLLDALIQQEAIIITVDTPGGDVEWSYGFNTTHWDKIRTWAMAYFDV